MMPTVVQSLRIRYWWSSLRAKLSGFANSFVGHHDASYRNKPDGSGRLFYSRIRSTNGKYSPLRLAGIKPYTVLVFHNVAVTTGDLD